MLAGMMLVVLSCGNNPGGGVGNESSLPPVPGDSALRMADAHLSERASEPTVPAAHVNAETVEWWVPESGERRSNRIIGSALIPDDDLNVGFWELAPRAIYAGHIHPAPEFYVVLKGQIEWTLGNDTFLAKPGEVIYIAPNTLHRMVNLTDEIARAIWGRWAPNGDRSVYQGESQYVEPLPIQPPEAVFLEPGQ